MSTAPVSVVVPCYRCVATIERAIASVAAQTLRPVEVVLVEDASGDDTLAVLHSIQARYGDWVKVVACATNRGAATARNIGWNLATQAYIAFLDADDTWHPQKIAIQDAYMLDMPGVAPGRHLCLQLETGAAVGPPSNPASSLVRLAARGHWGIKRGLDNIRSLLVALDHPEVALSGHLCRQLTQEAADAPPWPVLLQSVEPITWGKLLARHAFVTPSVMLKRNIALRFAEGQRHMEDHRLWMEIVGSALPTVKLHAELAAVYKPAFGASCLSACIWASEKAEPATYRYFHDQGRISGPLLLVLRAYSLLKYLRRLVIVRFLHKT